MSLRRWLRCLNAAKSAALTMSATAPVRFSLTVSSPFSGCKLRTHTQPHQIHVLTERVKIVRIRQRSVDAVDCAFDLVEALEQFFELLRSGIFILLEFHFLQLCVPAVDARAHTPPVNRRNDAPQ